MQQVEGDSGWKELNFVSDCDTHASGRLAEGESIRQSLNGSMTRWLNRSILRALHLCGRSTRGRLFAPRFLFPLRLPLLAQLLSLSIGHVAELLHTARIDLRRKHSIVLVDRDADQSLELPRQQSMPAK